MANTASLRYAWLLAPGSNHWASRTMYCQPWALSLSAMKAALAFACASVTVVARQSQLFQPMGGVGAQSWKSTAAACFESGSGRRHPCDASRQRVASSRCEVLVMML